MNYMDEGISFEAVMGDGSRPSRGFFDKAVGAGKRLLTGESLFMTHFTNTGRGKRRVAFAPPYPGTIIPMDLAAMGTSVDIALNRRLGEGLFLVTLEGSGTVYLQSLPFARLAARIIREIPQSAFAKGESSPLGGLGKMFMGD